MLKKLHDINKDIFNDKNNMLFAASDNKEIKEFIAKNSSWDVKEKYVKNSIKTVEGIENLKKTFTDLDSSTINTFLWPLKDDGKKISPQFVFEYTLIENDDADKFSKILDFIDLNKKDRKENNILHYAAHSAPKIFEVLFKKQKDLLKQKNKYNDTPLDKVLIFDNKDGINFIIENAELDKEEQLKIFDYALKKREKNISNKLLEKYPLLYNEKINLNNKNNLYLFLVSNKEKNSVYGKTDKQVIYDDVVANFNDNNYMDNFTTIMRNLSKENAHEMLWYNGEKSLMHKLIKENKRDYIYGLTDISETSNRFGTKTNLDKSIFKGLDGNNVLHQAALLGNVNVLINFFDKEMFYEKNNEGKTVLDIALEKNLDKEEQLKIFDYALKKDEKNISNKLLEKYPLLYNEKINLNNKNNLYLFLVKDEEKNSVYEKTDKRVIYDDVVANFNDNNYMDNFTTIMRNLSKENAYEMLWYNGENSLMHKLIKEDERDYIYDLINIRNTLNRFGTKTNLDKSIFKGPDGNNVLHQAALLGKVNVLRNLFDKDMLYEKNNEGKTVLDIALEQNNDEIIGYLLQNAKNINMTDETYEKIIAGNPTQWANFAIKIVENGDEVKFKELAQKDPKIYEIVDKFNKPLFFSAKNKDFKEEILNNTPAEIIKKRIISQKEISFLNGLNKEKYEYKILEIIKDYIDNFTGKEKDFDSFIKYLEKEMITYDMFNYAIEKNNLTAFKNLIDKKNSTYHKTVDDIINKGDTSFIYYLLQISPEKNYFFNQIDDEKHLENMYYVAIEIAKNKDIKSLKKLSKLKIFDKIKTKFKKTDPEQKNILVFNAIEKAVTKRYCDYYEKESNKNKKPEFIKKNIEFLDALKNAGVAKKGFSRGILYNADGTLKQYPGCMNENNTAWYFSEIQNKLIELSK